MMIRDRKKRQFFSLFSYTADMNVVVQTGSIAIHLQEVVVDGLVARRGHVAEGAADGGLRLHGCNVVVIVQTHAVHCLVFTGGLGEEILVKRKEKITF